MEQIKIKSIKKIDLKSHRYDITVNETNNYFANNILIHNCNASFTYAENKLWVKSRNFYKSNTLDETKVTHNIYDYIVNIIRSAYYWAFPKPIKALNFWWEVPIRLNLENKLKYFPRLSIYGELIGDVKHFKYDCQLDFFGKIQREFRVFDIYDVDAKKYLEWSQVECISQHLGLKTAPVLYKGPFKNDDALRELAEGKSTIGECVREGIVISSMPESNHPKLGRKIVKLKGRGYKLFKN